MNWRARTRAAQNAGVITRKERLTLHEVEDGAVVPPEARATAAKVEEWEKTNAPDAGVVDGESDDDA